MPASSTRSRIFLLSPANAGAERAQMVLNGRAQFDLAVQLGNDGAPIGDVFSFVSGLDFRGKLTYARAFAAPPPGVPGSLIITQGAGLVPPETVVTLDTLRAIASVPIDAADPRYREPLERDARLIAASAGSACDFILLGSIATGKYAEPLLAILGSMRKRPVQCDPICTVWHSPRFAPSTLADLPSPATPMTTALDGKWFRDSNGLPPARQRRRDLAAMRSNANRRRS